MQVTDDLYLGRIALPYGTPETQGGVGPCGRTIVRDFVPLALGTTNIAAAQAQTAGTPLTLTAGTGVTTALAPDGSQLTVYKFDVARAVSLTSAGNLSAGTFLVTGYSQIGAKMTQLVTGPNTNTVTSLKAFQSILSIVPNTTSATTVSAGSSDVFGMPYCILTANYVAMVRWAGVLAADTGTFVAADTTSPATNLTGDVCGTYLPSSASNGTKRLTIEFHLTAAQVGPQSTLVGIIGQPQA
jgi:hypothetical protein